MMRILVCGSRAWRQDMWEHVKTTLDATLGDDRKILLITGDADGVDYMAGVWASAKGIPHMSFTAAWHAYGDAAGPIRNRWMIEHGKPDMVIAFPGGRGTANMVRQAQGAGVNVVFAKQPNKQ